MTTLCILYCRRKADLSLCLGTTLQILPAGKLPLLAKKNKDGKMAVCNLQPTKYVSSLQRACGYIGPFISLLLPATWIHLWSCLLFWNLTDLCSYFCSNCRRERICYQKHQRFKNFLPICWVQTDIHVVPYTRSFPICWVQTDIHIILYSTIHLAIKLVTFYRLLVTSLSFTIQDKQADLIIHGYVDDIMTQVMERLSLTIPKPPIHSKPHLSWFSLLHLYLSCYCICV